MHHSYASLEVHNVSLKIRKIRNVSSLGRIHSGVYLDEAYFHGNTYKTAQRNEETRNNLSFVMGCYCTALTTCS